MTNSRRFADLTTRPLDPQIKSQRLAYPNVALSFISCMPIAHYFFTFSLLGGPPLQRQSCCNQLLPQKGARCAISFSSFPNTLMASRALSTTQRFLHRTGSTLHSRPPFHQPPFSTSLTTNQSIHRQSYLKEHGRDFATTIKTPSSTSPLSQKVNSAGFFFPGPRKLKDIVKLPLLERKSMFFFFPKQFPKSPNNPL